MNAWTGYEPIDYDDQDVGLDWRSLGVILVIFVVLTVWGIFNS
jgi:hypothetical protein